MLNQNMGVIYDGDWAKIFVDGVYQATVLSSAVGKAIEKIAGSQK